MTNTADWQSHMGQRARRLAARQPAAPQDPYNTLGARVEQILHYTPELADDPEGLIALARTPIPTSELGRASIQALSRVDYERLATARSSLSAAEQRALWEKDDPARRQMLRQAGYLPPDEQDGKSWFRIGIGVPTFVPWVGGRHVTLTTGHDNPVHQAAAGVVTAAAMPFKAIDRGTRFVGGHLFEGLYQLEQGTTGVFRASHRSGWESNLAAAVAFDKELRYRVERQIGQVDEATWRASAEGLVSLPSGAEQGADGHPRARAASDLPDGYLSMPDDPGFYNHFRQQGGVVDPQVRSIAEETAAFMRSEGITDTLSWWDAYQEVFNGESYVMPQRRNEVADRYLDGNFEALRLAEAVMVGRGIDEIAGERFDPRADPDGFLGEVRRLQELMGGTDPTRAALFEEAVHELGQGRFSIGREAARSFGFSEGSAFYHVVSGGLDAVTILTLDPTLGMGAAYRGLRGVTWVAKDLSRIEDTYHRAKGALGLVDATGPTYAHALVDAATNDETYRAMRVAGEAGLNFDDATRILGDRIAQLGRADFERMAKEANHRGPITGRARGIRDRGAISQWLATERIATAFRRTEANLNGVEALQRVSQMDNATLRRALRSGEVDDLWNLTAMGDLTQDLPHLTGGLKDLIDWHHRLVTVRGHGIRSAEDVWGFYRSTVGQVAIASRTIRGSNTWLRRGFELPRITTAGRRRIRAKAWFNEVIDWTQDASITLDGPTRIATDAADFVRAVQHSNRTIRVADRLIGNYMNPAALEGWRRLNLPGRAAAKGVRMAGDFIHSITTMLPLSTQLHLANEGFGEGVVAFERFAELGRLGELSSGYRRLALDEFISGRPGQLGNSGMLPASAATRGILFRGLIGDLADNLGIADSPAMRRYLEGRGVRAYAPNDLDVINMHGAKVPAALVPGVQMSDALAIPDFATLLYQARRQGALSKMFGFINHPIVDRFFTSYWRPAMLLRLGFIPRAAGEELLTYATRHGISDYLVHVAASYASNTQMVVKRMAANGDEIWDTVPRQLIGARGANRVLELLSREAIVAERLALYPVVERLHAAGRRLPAARRLAERLEASFTRTRRGVLPPEPPGNRRVWLVTHGDGDPQIFESLAATNLHLWRRNSTLAYADVDPNWLTNQAQMRANIVAQAKPVDHRAIFAGPLETPLVVSRWLAEKASALPRELVAKVLPRDLVESARIMRRGQQLHDPHNLDRSAMELAQLAAVSDALGQVDGVGGGRWLGTRRANTDGLVRVDEINGDEVILRSSREFREVGADDPMFHVKVAHATNALAESWAVRAGLEALDGHITTGRLAALGPSLDALEEALSPAGRDWLIRTLGVDHLDPTDIITGARAAVLDNPRWAQKMLRDALDEGIDAPAGFIPNDIRDRLLEQARVGDTITNREVLASIARPGELFEAVLNQWDDLPQDLLHLLVEAERLMVVSPADNMAALRNAIRQKMDDPEHAYEISRAHRMTTTSDGRPAAVLQPEHTERVYVPMLDDTTMEHLVSLHTHNHDALVRAILDANIDPSVAAYLTEEVLPFLSVGDVDAARATAMQIGRGAQRPTLPVGVRATYSPDLARDASQVLTEVVDQLVAAPRTVRRQGTYGIVESVPGFNYGHHALEAADGAYAGTQVRHLTRADTAGRITPIDPSTEVVRYSRSADPEGIYRLDDAGDIVVEGVGPDVLLDDWADKLSQMVAHHFFDNDGGVLHQIALPARRRRIREADVRRMGDAIPERVVHQHMVLPAELTQGTWAKIVEYGYDKVIGPAVSSIVRNPMFVRSYHAARQAASPIWDRAIAEAVTPGVAKAARQVGVDVAELIPLRREWQQAMETAIARGAPIRTTGDQLEWLATQYGVNLNAAELAQLDRFVNHLEDFHQKMANHVAARAVNDMVPYIDDHRFRSQFAGHMRNLAPFWFAEETFLKRWARTLKHSPEAFRRAQLYVGALENVGVIDHDQYGQKVLVYPGGEMVQEVLAPVTKALFGAEMTIPLTVRLTGQVQYVMPGLDRQGLPSFSPLLAVPMGALTNVFPELMSIDDTEALFGVRSLHTGLLDQVVPAWASRMFDAVMPTEINEQRLTTLSIQAIQQMEAEGQRALDEANQAEAAGDLDAARAHRERAELLMFPQTSDPYLVEDYLDRVKSWARSLLISQAVLGFLSPATPIPEFPNEITQQFLALTRTGMPFDEALGYMLAQDPGATPFTRFATRSTTGAVIPSHVEAGQWIDQNVEWLNSWRHAASWAIPQPDADSEFESMVYYEQLHMGLRERKTPAEFLQDIKFAQAAPVYFESQRNYERMLLELRQLRDAGHDVGDRLDELEVAWRAWQSRYLNQHPLFAERLQSADGKQRRERTIAEMRLMLADPAAPHIAHRRQLADMLESYDELNRLLGTVAGRSDPDATSFRHQVRAAFMDWAETYVAANPAVLNFYRSVIEPEAGLRNTVLMQEVLG